MSLLNALRKSGHDAKLEDMTVVVIVKPGGDHEQAEAWAKKHERRLRAELVHEIRKLCGLPGLRRADGSFQDVRGPDGEVPSGLVSVRIAVEVIAS